MSTASSSFNRDANRIPITANGLIATKTIAYNGTTSRGAQGATTLFTVTGDVAVNFFAKCTESLVSATGTIEVGISGNTGGIIEQTGVGSIDNGHIWINDGPNALEFLRGQQVVVGGTDIIETIATEDITDGTLTYYCLWFPLSSDGDVIAT
jgi:hypothetical protein